MAGQFAAFSANVGAIDNALRPLIKIPTGYGGVTLLNTAIISAAAATTGLALVDLGTAGTAVSGTLATYAGTLVLAVPNTGTISTAKVDDGHWIGLKETNAGTANAVTLVNLAYVLGE